MSRNPSDRPIRRTHGHRRHMCSFALSEDLCSLVPGLSATSKDSHLCSSKRGWTCRENSSVITERTLFWEWLCMRPESPIRWDCRQLREGRKGPERFDDSTEDERSSKLNISVWCRRGTASHVGIRVWCEHCCAHGASIM